jgi:hypothetical protein
LTNEHAEDNVTDAAKAVWRWLVAKYKREPAAYCAFALAAVLYYVQPYVPVDFREETRAVLITLFGLGVRQSVYAQHTVEKLLGQQRETPVPIEPTPPSGGAGTVVGNDIER